MSCTLQVPFQAAKSRQQRSHTQDEAADAHGDHEDISDNAIVLDVGEVETVKAVVQPAADAGN